MQLPPTSPAGAVAALCLHRLNHRRRRLLLQFQIHTGLISLSGFMVSSSLRCCNPGRRRLFHRTTQSRRRLLSLFQPVISTLAAVDAAPPSHCALKFLPASLHSSSAGAANDDITSARKLHRQSQAAALCHSVVSNSFLSSSGLQKEMKKARDEAVLERKERIKFQVEKSTWRAVARAGPETSEIDFVNLGLQAH